ncbi:MAG: type Z 30S ribosomal protein S14 [Candidatus Peribacteraceae bacterium]
MARDALIIGWRRKSEALSRAHAAGKKPKFPTRAYNRCDLCGRKGGYMRFFGICRICFRELATAGEVPGIKKSSW